MQMEQMSREEGKAVLSVYLKNGSQELRNKLIVHFLPIVRSAAAQLRGMSGSSTEEEDLIDQGVLALMECLDRYDVSKGAQFETYAFIRVRGAMIDYIRSQDWVPHRARSFQKRWMRRIPCCPMRRCGNRTRMKSRVFWIFRWKRWRTI